ncbi:MAG: succinate dehydrogenase, cytochrome b556 subunit [Chloroflexota bacterium]
MSSLILTIRESIRYRGRSGHISWIAHRLSGLAILAFLVIHVWDTANAYFWPQAYAWSLDVFKFPPIAVGELAIMAAVLYHAFNGIRITILDFKPEWWMHQQRSATIVWVIFFVLFIPIGIYMFSGIVGHCTELAAEGSTCWQIPSYSDPAYTKYAN